MRLAGHLGVRSPDAPLFRALAGSTDPAAQIALLASLGFAGVADNYLTLRVPAEQTRIGEVLAYHALSMGSIVHDPLHWNEPVWSGADPGRRAALATALQSSLAAAGRTGCATINCITGRDPALSIERQRADMAANLRWAAVRAADAGVALCIEATHPSFAPGLLIERWWDALALVREVDDPAVRLNLDIGHVALHGDDPIAAIDTTAPWLAMVQFADVPGRIEPGAGHLDWTAIESALDRAGYRGLMELELEPAATGEAGERAMLSRLANMGWTSRLR